MSFHVGQKVVCVDDRPGRHHPGVQLVLGKIYVIAGTDPETCTASVYLEGVPNLSYQAWYKHPHGWAAERFRPIVEPKAETSFTEGAPKDSKRWDNRVKKRERV